MGVHLFGFGLGTAVNEITSVGLQCLRQRLCLQRPAAPVSGYKGYQQQRLQLNQLRQQQCE